MCCCRAALADAPAAADRKFQEVWFRHLQLGGRDCEERCQNQRVGISDEATRVAQGHLKVEACRCGPTKWKLQAIRNANADWRSAESAPRWKKVCCKVSCAQDSREYDEAQIPADIFERSESVASNTPKNWIPTFLGSVLCFFFLLRQVTPRKFKFGLMWLFECKRCNQTCKPTVRCGTSRLLAVNGCQIQFAVFRLRGFHGGIA